MGRGGNFSSERLNVRINELCLICLTIQIYTYRHFGIEMKTTLKHGGNCIISVQKEIFVRRGLVCGIIGIFQ